MKNVKIMVDLTQSKVFAKLQQACNKLAKQKTLDLFAQDAQRFANFSRNFDQLFLDFSKQKISPEVFNLLLELADELNLEQAIKRLAHGDIVNISENKAALHMELRSPQANFAMQEQLAKIQDFVKHNKFKYIIHIGIGGSDLGPQMLAQALKPYALENAPIIHFISNTDNDHLQQILQVLDPLQTLCIISSKSFATIETLTLAQKVKAWYQQIFKKPVIIKPIDIKYRGLE